jgi:hypothetical protein
MPTSLSPAASLAAIEACEDNKYSIKHVKNVLLRICANLLTLDTKSTLWNTPPANPYAVSLATLHDRLHAGKPSPMPHIPRATASRHEAATPLRTSKHALNRPLEDFEYLYYAMLAKIQEICHILTLRVNNGFTSSTSPIFDNGPTLCETHARLQEYWVALNEPEFVKVLDSAVRRARVKGLHAEVLGQLRRGEISQSDSRELVEDLYTSGEDEVPGLAWIGGWAPSMIGAWLEEKFRIMFKAEREQKEADEKKRRDHAQKRKMREQNQMTWEQAWRLGYGESGTQQEREQLRLEFEREAQSVQENGRRLRESAGGNALGIVDDAWAFLGNA